MDIFIQLLINGLLLGGAYTIISLGLTLIFGVVRVVNFAHGDFLMVGMYMIYLLAANFGVHPYVGLIPIAVILFALGALTQKVIIQPLLDSSEEHTSELQSLMRTSYAVLCLNKKKQLAVHLQS